MHPEPVEKQFYLKDFRTRAILLHVDDARDLDDTGVVEELTDNPTFVIIVGKQFSRAARPLRVGRRDLANHPAALVPLTTRLLSDHLVNVRLPRGLSSPRALAFSRVLAARLGASKMVVVDERGGLDGTQGIRSFVNSSALAKLCRSEDDVGDWSTAELGQCLQALAAGVEAVNLTTAEGLAEELFTYQGSGTLFTDEEYCTVARLGVEHFSEAVRLLGRGEREGFLLVRSEEERLRLLLGGYGAWFGGVRLAGVCGLETEIYTGQRVAEIVGLYTITRFQGEGVGVRMIDHLVEVARQRRLKALFACTSNARAAAFFQRCGFGAVEPEAVPKAKWVGRRSTTIPLVFWLSL